VYKQWGAQNFIALALALTQSGPVSLILVGGKAENAMAVEITSKLNMAGVAVHALIAEPLDQVAALLAYCDLYLGNDTGMLNLAAASGTKALGLFCGRHPVLHYSSLLHAVVAPDKRIGIESISVAMVLAYLRTAHLLPIRV
jgi:heptosyltransferase II